MEFRLAHLDNDRLKAVLQAAAEKFGWQERRKKRRPGTGIGLACGTEKNSVVAACCEVEVDPQTGTPRVIEFVEAFECGAILNPANLRSQVEGAIMMGLGPALREEVLFKGGKPTMFICGNDAAAKKNVSTVLVQFGWETADMGTAVAARAIEPLSMLWCIPGFLQNDWVHAFKLLR